MPSLASDSSSDIVSFKVIGIGTALVLAAVFLVWLSHVAAGERMLREQERLNEMAAESRALCAKWGMPDGSPKFAACLTDVDQVRENHARRMERLDEPF